jgi:putative hydrolase of the HAD superfamily
VRHRDQCLLIDADDTLWENNVFFERVIAHFIAQLNHSRFSPVEVRERLNEIERRNIISHGYGVKSFSRALACAYEELAEHPPDPEAVATISELALAIAQEPIQLLPEVRETLDYLSQHHRLVLFTKGDLAEQSSKVERSGLRRYFTEIRIVAEKNAQIYRHTATDLGENLSRMWMVGNSPRSDINPALAAGIRAVFVPHDNTWILEHEDLAEAPSDRLLQLERFADLRRHF